MFVSLLVSILAVVSFSCGVCVQKSCPLGMFCPIGAKCSSNVSLCVAECNLKTSQGNWSSGNCERVPEEIDYWLDATFYEALIPPNLNLKMPVLNITLSLVRLSQTDDEDVMFSGSGSGSDSCFGSGCINDITFHLETDYPYFKFDNGNTTHIALDDAASLTKTCTIVKATSDPISLGDYEMQISVTRQNNILQNSSILLHVVESLPSSLPAPVTCVEFEVSEYAVLESVGLLNVTLILMGETQPVSFNVTVIANGSSSATAGLDFTPGRYIATFSARANKATVSIPIIVDNIAEETEQFNLRLYIDGTGYGLGLQSGNIKNATVFIIQPNITGVIIEFKEKTYSVIEDASVYNVTVVKKGNSMKDIEVNIFPSPETAKFRSDYSLASVGKIVFTAGGPDEQTIQLSVDEDDFLELNETYLLELNLTVASIAAGARIGAINQARVTIINDDRIQVLFQHKLTAVREIEDAIIPVGFSPQKTTIPFTVIVETFDLSPPDAQAGIDYQPLIRNITLSQSVASAIIQVDIIENNITDGNRQFGLRIVIPEEAQQLGIDLGTPSELNITIIDDDVGDLEVTCFTNSTGDIINGHDVLLQCNANQIVAYTCRVNGQLVQPCLNPQLISNVDTSDSVIIMVTATALNMPPVSLDLIAFTVKAELQMLSAGMLAVHLQASKNATFRCRLNDMPYITCVDGQIFDDLNAGKYTVTILARGIENMQDTASYTIGPVVITAGVNATENEAIAACFGRWATNCNNNDQDCEYAANWRTKVNQVEFTVTAQTQGWLSIGFSIDNKMPHSDVIVGATDGSNFFVDDSYAAERSSPQKDAIQNIHNTSATIINGVTTIKFVRDKITSDSTGDLNLNFCHFVLFAWGDNADVNTKMIQYHGLTQRNSSDELICFPFATLCPRKFDCGDPGMPINGARNFSSTLEDSVVTYSCDPGYELIGNSTRVCKVTAEEGALWKYDIPECQSIALPNIIIQPLDITVELNNETTSIQLRCMANETIFYTWERRNGIIPNDAEGINTNMLTLIDITPSDSGQYRCIASNEHGKDYSEYATVIITARPPVVNVTPSSVTASEGDSVTFTCLTTGVGARNFTYEWLLNGSVIKGVTELNYTITAVSESAVGNYTCVVKNQYGGSSQSNIATLTLKPPFCNSVTESYPGFNITWDETQVGDTVEVSCIGAGLTGTVRRICTGDDIWEEFIECIREEIDDLIEETTILTSSLSNITDMDIISEVDDIVIKLANLTSPDQIQTQFPSEVNVAVDIFSSLNNVTETVIDMLQPNDTFFEKTVQILDNLLSNANEGSWQKLQKTSPSTSQRFIINTEKFGRLLGKTLGDATMKSLKTKENIVIKAEIVTKESIGLEQPYVFPDNSDDIASFSGRNGHILFPNLLLKDALDKMPQGSTEFIITNSLLRDGSLPLPNPPNGGTMKMPVSSIISSQLPTPIDATKQPITLIFDVPSGTLDLRSNDITSRQQHTCEFYNHTLSLSVNQTGAWSNVGVKLDKDHSNETTVICLSTHLTSFAVLVGNQNETQSSPTDDERSLPLIAYIGSAISLTCLTISIIVLSFILCKSKGKENHVFVHLNLCIALALGLVVFIAGIENATDETVSCVIVAALLQYFFTSAFCWMLCEGVMLYMMLITVFGNKLNHKWFSFILGWGPGIPIVGISLGITHEQYGTDDHCWIESGNGALAAFIVPIVLVIVITCTFLMISLRVLYGNQRKTIDKKKPIRKAVKAIFKVAVIFLPLLCVTWIFGILAVNEEAAVFAVIFTILNILLGLLIFVLYVLRDEQVGLNKKMEKVYKSETFYSFYSGIRYYTVSRTSNNGKKRSSNGDTNNHNAVKTSTSVNNMEEQSTTTTTFKPPDESEIPLEDRDTKRDIKILMVTNPTAETTMSEDTNTTVMEKEMTVEEKTVSVPINEN